MLSQVIEDGQIVDSYFTADPLTLNTKNADTLILGSSTTEGGDIKVYRDTSGNLQMSLDADAASNTKALDIYGGVVAQNYLTVGQSTLNTSYTFYVVNDFKTTRHAYIEGSIFMGSDIAFINGKGIKSRTDNIARIISGNIGVSGTDATNHDVCLQIDSNDIICVQATGNGAGGITDKAIGLYGTTPATQAATIADATDNATAITQLNLLLAANRNIGLIET